MTRLIVFTLLFGVIDFYLYRVVKFLTRNQSSVVQYRWLLMHVGLSLLILLSFAWVVAVNINLPYDRSRRWTITILSLVQGIYISKLVAVLFFVIDDIRRLLVTLKEKVIKQKVKPLQDSKEESNTIPRSAFLSWTGTAIGFTLFGSLLKGFSNKYNYEIKKITLPFATLPPAFHHFKILQISDIHAGSFDNKEAVSRGVALMMNEKPDMIVFTGDLVNNRASEMDEYMEVFAGLKAPYGVYSIFGNHDYGDYVTWESEEVKKQNLNRLKEIHQQLGWRLLLNEHVSITKGESSIALLGIENWGAGNLSRYGDMEEAHRGSEHYPFKVLLSHDPSHWNAEVCKHYPTIDLTLSGHTHGLQFGVETSYFKWSPAQWFYKQWAGLYRENKQLLYVNRGFGFIGYQGRVGIMPEITVLKLEREYLL